MQWIYLSPHLDDVALSLGGLLWEQAAAGESAYVWTICAGDPPPGPLSPFAESLHGRWGAGREAIARRRAEDIESCAILGAAYRHFPIPDCIYRRSEQSGEYLYASEDSLNGPLHPDEQSLVWVLRKILKAALTPGVRLVCPIGLGDHVGHRLTRTAADGLDIPLWYYADYPYVRRISNWEPKNLEPTVYPISAEGIAAWQDSVAAHRSQISTFWESISVMKTEISEYVQQMKGAILWRVSERMF